MAVTPRPFDKKMEEMHLSEKEWRRFAELSEKYIKEEQAKRVERRRKRAAGKKKYHKVRGTHGMLGTCVVW